MRLLVFLLLFFLVACSSNSQEVQPKPPPNYCFENQTTRNVVRAGLLTFAIWATVESPDIAVNVLVLAFFLKGIDLFFSEPKETLTRFDEEANQILCEL